MKRAIALHRAKRNGGAAVRNSSDSDSADHAHGPASDPVPRPSSIYFSCENLVTYGVPKKKVDLFSFSHSFILIFALVEPTAKVPTSNAIWDHYGGAPIWLRW